MDEELVKAVLALDDDNLKPKSNKAAVFEVVRKPETYDAVRWWPQRDIAVSPNGYIDYSSFINGGYDINLAKSIYEPMYRAYLNNEDSVIIVYEGWWVIIDENGFRFSYDNDTFNQKYGIVNIKEKQ